MKGGFQKGSALFVDDVWGSGEIGGLAGDGCGWCRWAGT